MTREAASFLAACALYPLFVAVFLLNVVLPLVVAAMEATP